ncbi:Pyruvate synthase subunit PorA [compost metagenome]
MSHLKAVAVLDKADSLNAAGGALFEDITSAMYVNKSFVPMVNYIYGIGGRDTKSDDIETVFTNLQEIVKDGKVTDPYRYLGLRKGDVK